MRFTKLLIFIILLFSFRLVSSQVIFKNAGWNKVYVAICFMNNGSWTPKGWYTVDPNEQKVVYTYTIFNNPRHFEKYGSSISGITYKAIQKGPAFQLW